MKIFKQFLLFSLTLILVICNFSSLVIASSTNQIIETSKAKAILVYDNDNNQILYQKNIHQSLPIASLTKLLTILTVEQQSNNSDYSNRQILVHDKNLVKFSLNPNYSNIPLQLNQTYSLQTLMEMAMFNSSDAAALALANSDYDLFNREMLKTAKDMNLHDDYHFYNTVGLQNGDMDVFKDKTISNKADNSMSAYDLAKVSSQFIKKNPKLLNNITSRSSYQFNNKKYNNSNKFLTNKNLNTSQIKVDGLKTGTSDSAGNNLITTGTYNGRRLTFIVLGASTDIDRYNITNDLMNYVLNQYELINLKKVSLKTINVTNGQSNSVKPVVKDNKVIWIKKSNNLQKDLNKIVDEKIINNNAPLYRNKPMGKLIVKINTINGTSKNSINIYPSHDVLKQLSFWQKLFYHLPVGAVVLIPF